MPRVVISDHVVVGAPPHSNECVADLAHDGFQSILNLRPAGMSSEFSSRDEGVAASRADLTYLYQPIAADEFDEFHVESVRAKLAMLPKPVFVHADHSPRAAAYCLIDRALSDNWTGDEAMQHAEALGLDFRAANLHDIVKAHVDQNRDSPGASRS